MEPITKLDQMFDALKQSKRKRLVAAYANDSHTIEAVNEAVEKGIVEAILVGDETIIKNVCEQENIDINRFKIVHETSGPAAAAKSVEIINNGDGDVLMKGLVSTEDYMRAILNKEKGLLAPGAILSHVTVIENAKYHKLLTVGDVAVIPKPDLKTKIAIIKFLVHTAQRLGIQTPKTAIIAATEKVNAKMPACVDAAIICQMANRGQIKNTIIDGPLAVDLAVDMESVQIKGINSLVAGDADCLLFPDIQSGNVFYKTNTKLADAKLGAIVVGAKKPAVLSSRGDTAETKLYSIALAALTA
ncbi:phosphate butyryltransferase [bacterium]|nr:phosphate butyryltransferase [bacterium]